MSSQKIFVALISLLFFYIAYPLILPIVMGGVLAVLFFPWLKRIEAKGVPSLLGSGFLTGVITIVFILPTSFLGFFVAKASIEQIQSWKLQVSSAQNQNWMETLLQSPKLQGYLHGITHILPLQTEELMSSLRELAFTLGAKLAEWFGGMFSQLPGLTLSLMVMVVSFYFFLLDGRKFLRFIRTHSVFTPHQTEVMIRSLGDVCRSVILAALISGSIQAFVQGVTCVVLGVNNVALIGLLVFITSFIPVAGASLVTFPMAFYQLVAGDKTTGVVLLVIAFIILGIDNTIRPLFLKGTVNLHPLIAFAAAFGGLQTLGFLGVFLGPIVAALFISTLSLLRPTSSAHG